jgi:hypothetical protein
MNVKQILNSILLMSLFFFSCNLKKDGSILSKPEVDQILDEEVDDSDLIADVNNSRDATKNLLNLNLVTQMGLKEIYLHEEPLSLNFTDPSENLVSFEAMNLKRSEIDNYLLSLENDTIDKIKEMVFEDKIIKYIVKSSGTSKNITSFINCSNADRTLKMILYCKSNEVVLLQQYSTLTNCKN